MTETTTTADEVQLTIESNERREVPVLDANGRAWIVTRSQWGWLMAYGVRHSPTLVDAEATPLSLLPGPLTVLRRPDQPVPTCQPREDDLFATLDASVDPIYGFNATVAVDKLIALIPGRSEAEVKAEALTDAADALEELWALGAPGSPRSTVQVISWLRALAGSPTGGGQPTPGVFEAMGLPAVAFRERRG